MEGQIVLKFNDYCDYVIKTLLKNGYSLTLDLINDNEDLRISYIR